MIRTIAPGPTKGSGIFFVAYPLDLGTYLNKKDSRPFCRKARDQSKKTPGRSSAWLERMVWDHEVAGSNPVAPTFFRNEPSTLR